jgi:hypothetical protein
MNEELKRLWIQAAPEVTGHYMPSGVPLAPALARFAVLIAERCADAAKSKYDSDETWGRFNAERDVRALAEQWRVP